MSKVDFNVKPNYTWNEERDLIDKLLQGKQAAQERFLSTFERDRYADNPITRFRDCLQGVQDSNPILDIFLSCLHKLTAHGDPFYWQWHSGDAWDYGSDMSQKLNVSRMEIDHQSHITGGDPWTHRFVETISINIYGHGCGEAFLGGFWNFNYRTKYFLECVKQLLVGMSHGDDLDLRLVVEYTGYQRNAPVQSWMANNGERVTLKNVNLISGDLVLYSDYLEPSALDRICSQINHSVINIMNRKIANKARKAMFVCSPKETMFHLEYDPKLQSMMEGASPTEEELMMMSIAGYEDEFWLDNVKSFDRLNIKPFNLEEAVKWYQQTRVVFKL